MSRYQRHLDYSSLGALKAALTARGEDQYQLPLFRPGFAGDPAWVVCHFQWNDTTGQVDLVSPIDYGKATADAITIGGDSSYDIYPASGTPTAPTFGDPDGATPGLIFANDGDWVGDLGYPDVGDFPLLQDVFAEMHTTESGAPNTSWAMVGGCRKANPSAINYGHGPFKDGAGDWFNGLLLNSTVIAGSARNAPGSDVLCTRGPLSSNRPFASSLNSNAHSVGTTFGQGIPRIGLNGSEVAFGYDGTDPVSDAFYFERNGFTFRLTTMSFTYARPA